MGNTVEVRRPQLSFPPGQTLLSRVKTAPFVFDFKGKVIG
jgi:hypothetical protein